MREKLGRLIDVVAELIDALERSRVDYALGGALLEIQGGAFDRLFVRRWLVRMLGEDDERILTWDRDFMR